MSLSINPSSSSSVLIVNNNGGSIINILLTSPFTLKADHRLDSTVAVSPQTIALVEGDKIFGYVKGILCLLTYTSGVARISSYLPLQADLPVLTNSNFILTTFPSNFFPLTNNFTIPTSGSVEVICNIPSTYVPPTDQSFSVTIKNIQGNLSKLSTSWTFTPSKYPTSTLDILASVDYFTVVSSNLFVLTGQPVITNTATITNNSTPVNLNIDPSTLLQNGESANAIIKGVGGTLSKINNFYSFIAIDNVSAPITLLPNDYIVLTTPSSNPLSIGSTVLKTIDKNLSIEKADSLSLGSNLIKILFGDKFSGWFLSFRDKADQIAFGLKTNGSLYLGNFEISNLLKAIVGTNKFSGYLISFRDSYNRIIAAIKINGSVFIHSLTTKSLGVGALNASTVDINSKNVLSLRDSTNNISYALRKDGTHYLAEVEVESFRDNGAFDFLKAKFTINNFLYYLNAKNIDTWIISISGQSNSIGADGILDSTSSGVGGYLDTTQPYTNLKLLDSGTAPLYDGSGDSLSLIALVEPLKPISGPNAPAYPGNISGQSQASAIANELSSKLPGWQSVVGSYGIGGVAFESLKKGGTSNCWASMLYETNAIKTLLVASGKKYRFGAHFFIHGEGDAYNTNYQNNLNQYVQDLQDDLLPISGQKEAVPLIISQQNTFPYDSTGGISPQLQFQAARDNPLIFLVGPTYQHRFASQAPPINGSGVHRDAWSFRAEGIKFAQVANLVQIFGANWKPVQPNLITVSGNRIRLKFDVPYGPLRFDPFIKQPALMNGAPNPWYAGKGFEVYDASGNPIFINDCRIISNDEVEIVVPRLSKPATIKYAWALNYVAGGVGPFPSVCPGGRNTGRRGSLCDSDPYRGYDTTVISCEVTNGSTAITTSANAFKPVGWYFRVHGTNIPEPTIISSRTSDNSLTLSNPYSGPTGTQKLTFHSDQSNYCVAFSLPVNYST